MSPQTRFPSDNPNFGDREKIANLSFWQRPYGGTGDDKEGPLILNETKSNLNWQTSGSETLIV